MSDLIFFSQEHKEFFYKFVPDIGNDVYFKPVIYLLGLCADTRDNYKSIFNPEEKEMRVEGLNSGWQTGTSMKITRLAFNLWNGNTFESIEDYEEDKVSSKYAVDNIFCCSYAPYFYEAVKLRYPEYCVVRQKALWGKTVFERTR